jgi:hypothetical protein
VKIKISNALRGIIRSTETKQKMSKSKKGRIVTDDVKIKISNTRKNTKVALKENNPFYGKIHTEETKQHMSYMKTIEQKKECEYCKKLFYSGMYSRWHGEKCKLKGLT